MNAILVSVNYSDFLQLTLPYNRHHFDEVMVVTSLNDSKTLEITLANNCKVHRTNAFYEKGALFSKWKALEEGLDILGRKGWLCIMDADVCWPKYLPGPRMGTPMRASSWVEESCKIGHLCTPRRYMMEDTSFLQRDGIPSEEEWSKYPLHRQEREWAGYTQIFHAQNPHLPSPPWHDTSWQTCAGADSFFQARWPTECKIRPPWNVLHLGSAGKNWVGRATPYLDGTTPDKAQEKVDKVRELIRLRGTHPSGDRFGWEKVY